MKSKKHSKQELSLYNQHCLKILCSISFAVLGLIFLFLHRLDSKPCSTILTSTCSGIGTSRWNKKDVEKELKEWITTIKFNVNENSLENENKCINFFISQNKVFHNYGTDAISDKVMLFGNTLRVKESNATTKVKFDGPVWMDLNNHAGWTITQHHRKAFKIEKKENLRNGFYYGELKNEDLKIGNVNYAFSISSNNLVNLYFNNQGFNKMFYIQFIY